MKRTVAITVGLSILLLSCSRNPVSGRPEMVVMSTEKEVELGREEAQKVDESIGLLDNRALRNYVKEIGSRLAKHSPRQDVEYHFDVVEMKEPNAFALPGGWVYVSRGLLALVNEESELAGVIGHEIGHVAARHSVRRVTVMTPFAVIIGIPVAIISSISSTLGAIVAAPFAIGGGLALARYSRGQENQADVIGMEIAAKAGYDPTALGRFLTTLGREDALARDGEHRKADFFDSHPSTPDRVVNVHNNAAKFTRAAGPPAIAPTRAALLGRLEGLLVGENPAAGLFIGDLFVHPTMDIAMTFPAKWQTENMPSAVAAVDPQAEADAFVILQIAAKGTDPMEGVKADEVSDRMLEGSQRTTINGLPAVRLVTSSKGHGFDITWIAHKGLVFRIVGAAPNRDFPTYSTRFRQAAESFRRLTASDRERMRESRLRVRQARAGEGLDAFVRRTGSTWDAARSAVANGLADGATLEAGELMKVPILQRYAPSR